MGKIKRWWLQRRMTRTLNNNGFVVIGVDNMNSISNGRGG